MRFVNWKLRHPIAHKCRTWLNSTFDKLWQPLCESQIPALPGDSPYNWELPCLPFLIPEDSVFIVALAWMVSCHSVALSAGNTSQQISLFFKWAGFRFILLLLSLCWVKVEFLTALNMASGLSDCFLCAGVEAELCTQPLFHFNLTTCTNTVFNCESVVVVWRSPRAHSG